MSFRRSRSINKFFFRDKSLGFIGRVNTQKSTFSSRSRCYSSRRATEVGASDPRYCIALSQANPPINRSQDVRHILHAIFQFPNKRASAQVSRSVFGSICRRESANFFSPVRRQFHREQQQLSRERPAEMVIFRLPTRRK